MSEKKAPRGWIVVHCHEGPVYVQVSLITDFGNRMDGEAHIAFGSESLEVDETADEVMAKIEEALR